ncbi:MAG: hypothetical protein V4537_14575 [Pseudomonadota bacterium]
MLLGELIEGLSKLPPDLVLPKGWDEATSYRGYYDQLAFVPAENVAVRTMLMVARAAVGQTFQGYKGGDYTMGFDTMTHIANWGDSNGDDTTMARWFMGIEMQRLGARTRRLEELLRGAFKHLETAAHPLDGSPHWYNLAREEFPEVVLDPPPKRIKVRCSPDAEDRVRELFRHDDPDITVEADRASGNFIVDLPR